jgi:hypothetical protein
MESRSEKILEFFKEKALKMYKDKSGLVQLIPIVVVLSLVAIVCPLFSGFTEFTEMYSQFSAKDSTGGLFWTICIMVSIEGVKLVAGSVFFVKIWSGAWDYILIFFVLFVSAQAASIFFSVKGSERIPETLGTPPVKIAAHIIDIDSINVRHDSLIQAATIEVSTFFNQNSKYDAKKGIERIKSTFAKEHISNRQLLKTAKKTKEIAIDQAAASQLILNEKAEAEHLVSVAEYEASNRSKGSTFWYLSVFVELIYFLSQAFLTWFYYQLFRDESSENGTDKIKRQKPVKQKVVTNSGTVNKTVKKHVPSIGFKQNGTVNNGTGRACFVCGTNIDHKRKDATVCGDKCRKEKHLMKNKN